MSWLLDILFGIAFVFLVEGIVLAAFPRAPKIFMTLLAALPSPLLRNLGLASIAFGALLMWLLKG